MEDRIGYWRRDHVIRPGPDSMNDMPEMSFGFIKGPVCVLRNVKLLYLSLDLEPGPYDSVPRVADPGDQDPDQPRDPGGA